jgi:hypothetical protein
VLCEAKHMADKINIVGINENELCSSSSVFVQYDHLFILSVTNQIFVHV